MTKKYIRKFEEIEAEQFLPEKGLPYPEGVKRSNKDFWGELTRDFYYLDTMDDSSEILPGDYIITRADGKRYSCDAKWFEKTFEPVEE